MNVKTYPNPFVNAFTFEINSTEAKDAKLSVYNLNGQVMISEDIKTDNGYFKKQFNTEGFSAGLYIVEVSNSKGTV
ncbi:T9SS type A sorting domain-containing protein, partial [Enterococcus faecalis]|uniref:T9SS type A sorting domain-containing protein n=1 Tax=Enterococcus faecalis TaxID=1351 RepID=UPI0040396424